MAGEQTCEGTVSISRLQLLLDKIRCVNGSLCGAALSCALLSDEVKEWLTTGNVRQGEPTLTWEKLMEFAASPASDMLEDIGKLSSSREAVGSAREVKQEKKREYNALLARMRKEATIRCDVNYLKSRRSKVEAKREEERRAEETERRKRLQENQRRFEAACRREKERRAKRDEERQACAFARSATSPATSPLKRRAAVLTPSKTTPPRRKHHTETAVRSRSCPVVHGRVPGVHLHDDYREVAKLKDEWAAAQRELRQRMEEDHPFHPTITKYAKSIQRDPDREAALREERQKRQAWKWVRPELFECTFHPDVRTTRAATDESVYHRLYSDASHKQLCSEVQSAVAQ
eukprot:Sspe_Gene.77074::Locus_48140_Transcript_1_1_Confidence_1.000_Length_1111::g.77074::m.77074